MTLDFIVADTENYFVFWSRDFDLVTWCKKMMNDTATRPELMYSYHLNLCLLEFILRNPRKPALAVWLACVLFPYWYVSHLRLKTVLDPVSPFPIGSFYSLPKPCVGSLGGNGLTGPSSFPFSFQTITIQLTFLKTGSGTLLLTCLLSLPVAWRVKCQVFRPVGTTCENVIQCCHRHLLLLWKNLSSRESVNSWLPLDLLRLCWLITLFREK